MVFKVCSILCVFLILIVLEKSQAFQILFFLSLDPVTLCKYSEACSEYTGEPVYILH